MSNHKFNKNLHTKKYSTPGLDSQWSGESIGTRCCKLTLASKLKPRVNFTPRKQLWVSEDEFCINLSCDSGGTSGSCRDGEDWIYWCSVPYYREHWGEDHNALKIASQRCRRIKKFCKVLEVIGKQSCGSACATTQGKSFPNDSMGGMWAKVRFLDPKLGIFPFAWEVQNLDWFGLGFTKVDGAWMVTFFDYPTAPKINMAHTMVSESKLRDIDV